MKHKPILASLFASALFVSVLLAGCKSTGDSGSDGNGGYGQENNSSDTAVTKENTGNGKY